MMEGKRVKDSSVIMAQMMIPQDANPAGNVHGGVVVKIIDEAAGVRRPTCTNNESPLRSIGWSSITRSLSGMFCSSRQA
jgi:hypothetical protein